MFADVADAEIDRMLMPIDNLRYAQKSVVFVSDDPGRAIYTIRRGAVKLLQTLADGTDRAVRFLTAGDVFGIEALLGRTYAHTAVAL
ncbi:MAG TPA: cyclic nucleotide-binding domain-containing protein, partial [Gammaproteobacteria bacterium]